LKVSAASASVSAVSMSVSAASLSTISVPATSSVSANIYFIGIRQHSVQSPIHSFIIPLKKKKDISEFVFTVVASMGSTIPWILVSECH
jgi:hypothetical protein